MKVIVVPSQKSLIDLLADRLVHASQPLPESWVVFPEKRPGHYLIKALAQRLKKSFLPPKTDSFDGFVDRLYTENLGLEAPLLTLIDAVSILYELHRTHPEHQLPAQVEEQGHNFPRSSQNQFYTSLDQFFSLGIKLYQDLEELKLGMVSRDKFLMIDSLVAEKIPVQTRNRFQKLSFFFEQFYSWLEREKFSTRASRLETVLKRIELEQIDDFNQLILAGFFVMSRAEATLLKKFLTSEKTSLYLIDSPGLEEIVRQLELSPRDLERIESPAEIQTEMKFHHSPDSHGQLFLLRNLMAEKITNLSLLNERQVIVLPAAETLIPLEQQALSEIPQEFYNLSLGYPLTRTPVFSFFDNLFNLLQGADEDDRFYIPDYLNFVLHPYTKNIYFPGQPRRAEFTRILFHLLQTVLTEKKGKLFWGLKEIEAEPELNRRLARYAAENPEAPEASDFLRHLTLIHQTTIQPFLSLENIRDFADKLSSLLEFLKADSTASLHIFFQPYTEAIFGCLESLKNSFSRGLSFVHISSYFNLFRRLLAEARVPFPGTPLHGLQVLGFWETRCLSFDEVYLLDMNEEVIPGTGRGDTLLPYDLRKALSLQTHEDREKRMEYYLRALVSGARKVHFFFIENSQTEKSRYLEKLIWEKQKEDQQPDSSKYFDKLSYRMDLTSPEPPDIPKTGKIIEFLKNLEFSASRLDAYLTCPLKFYYSVILRLEEKEAISEGLEQSQIGTLVHEILRSYFKPYLGKELPARMDLATLTDQIESIFGARFSQPLSGNFYLMKEQIKSHLEDFILDYQLPLAKKLGQTGLKLLALEKKVSCDYQIEGVSFSLSGRLDRIEKRNSYLCLLDYKTSANEKYHQIDFKKLDLEKRLTWPEAIGSLQLPFYQLLLALEANIPAEDIYAAVLLLGKNRIDEKIEYSPLIPKKSRSQPTRSSELDQPELMVFPFNQTEEDLELRKENFRLIKEVIERLLLEIISPEIPFSASLSRKDSCSHCPYSDFCSQ